MPEPWSPPPPRQQQRSAPRRIPQTITGVFLTCVLTGIAGVPGGLAWAAIAPRAQVVVTGRGAVNVINPETSAFIAADGWFCVVGLAGGLLCGFAAYLATVRRYGALAAAALIIGAFAASLVGWWVGHSIGLSGFHAGLMTGHAGTVLHAPLTLRARSALASWPFGAALVVVAAEMTAGWRNRPPRAGGAGTQWAEANSRLRAAGGARAGQ